MFVPSWGAMARVGGSWEQEREQTKEVIKRGRRPKEGRGRQQKRGERHSMNGEKMEKSKKTVHFWVLNVR